MAFTVSRTVSVAVTTTDHTIFTPLAQGRQSPGSLFTIHGVPNRSTTMPKPGDQKVF
jgi:hypothetical protein